MASERSETRAWVVPLVLALVALALRLPGLDGGMWNDEIAAIIQSFRTSFPENLSEFRGDNKHPLYALLAHLCIALFGESAWAIRLPALLFGVAAVPMLYWLAKPFVGRREAIAAAALLAVSYHHIWFSQSARGYSALLFFALLTTHQMFAMLRRGDRRMAWAFGICIALGTYAHLTFVFFVFAQFLLALLMWARPVAGARPDWRLVLLPFVGGGILSAAMHFPMLDPMLAYFTQPSDQTGVSSPKWALEEGLRVLQAGFGDFFGLAIGALAVAVPVGLAGWWTWLRRDRDMALLMVLAPMTIIVGALIGRGTMYPRFFFVLGGFFILVVVRGAWATGAFLARLFARGADSARVTALGERLGFVGVGVLVLASLASLPRNWRVDKQDFEGPLALVRQRAAPGDQVAVADVTAAVYLLYYQLPWTRVKTADDLDALRSRGRVWFLYTFPRYLDLYDPGLAAHVDRDCHEEEVFPATLGGGEVIVCTMGPLTPAAPAS